jgi:hypothetical protein
MKVIPGFFALISAMSLIATAQDVSVVDANEARQIRFAEQAIIVEMTRELSLLVREIREKNLLACPEAELCQAACPGSGEALELAIGLIGGIGRSDAATNALVRLLGFRLDGAGSQELDCQILTHGRALSGRLERLQAKSVVEHCQSTFYELRKRELRNISDVKVEQICCTETEIRSRRDELLEAIKSDVECPLW